MSDYAPLYMPGDSITGTVSAAVIGGRALAVSGNGTVAHAAADSNAVVGTAAFDQATVGGLVTFHGRGQVHTATAAGAITAGDRLNTAAAGTVKTATAGVGNIGIALTTAADTASVTYMEC